MAEFSILHTTGTSGDGASTYTEAQATDAFGDFLTPNSSMTAPHASQGVYAGAGGELAVTGSTSPVSVAAGAASVAGFLYRNTSAVTVTIPTPTSNTRIDRIVLRMSWSAHTVRITRIAGTEGGAAPALTQIDGTTWDIPLAQASITIGGAITLTDERTFCHFGTRLDFTNIDGGTSTRIPYFASTGRLTSEAALAYDATNDRVRLQGAAPGLHVDETDGTKGALVVLNGGAWQVQRTASGFGAAEATPFSLDLVSGILALSGSPALSLWRRQGGSATSFATGGTTNYTPASARLQLGTILWNGTAATTGTQAITFPTAFSAAPWALVCSADAYVVATIVTTASGATITWRATDGVARGDVTLYWLAIGPE